MPSFLTWTLSRCQSAQEIVRYLAEIKDDSGNITQRIYYESRVNAGIDMSKIKFDVDEENKTIMPLLPDIMIYDPNINESSFEYMPENPNLSLNEIIALCKEDARSEANSQGEIYETAEYNLRTTITALTLPLIDKSGYTLIWEQPDNTFDSGAELSQPSNDQAIIEEQSNES